MAAACDVSHSNGVLTRVRCRSCSYLESELGFYGCLIHAVSSRNLVELTVVSLASCGTRCGHWTLLQYCSSVVDRRVFCISAHPAPSCIVSDNPELDIRLVCQYSSCYPVPSVTSQQSSVQLSAV